MNNVCLIGRLSSDVELKSTSGGTNYARFSIAVQRDFKNKDGEYEADFINCIAWRNTAEFIAKYFIKGQGIGAVGRIEPYSYDDNGTTRYGTNIVVEKADFTSGKPSGAASSRQTESRNIDSEEILPMPGDDDLPF